MDRKQMCIANLTYKKPTSNEQKRMKNLLKYLTYRDSRDKYVPQVTSMERWVDHGMGNSIHEIAQRCDGYQSEHVLMFSLVMNPNPDLVNLIPQDEREQFVRRLTENTVEDFFDSRGIDTGVEYSFVTHHRETDGEEQPGQRSRGRRQRKKDHEDHPMKQVSAAFGCSFCGRNWGRLLLLFLSVQGGVKFHGFYIIPLGRGESRNG